MHAYCLVAASTHPAGLAAAAAVADGERLRRRFYSAGSVVECGGGVMTKTVEIAAFKHGSSSDVVLKQFVVVFCRIRLSQEDIHAKHPF